jgi:O-antigen ligase/polysaccharide polymerase Wzy-like membrane protein
LAFAVSVAEATTSRAVSRSAVEDIVLGAPIAAAIWFATRSHGAYEIGTWAPLGLALLAVALVLWIAGWRLSRRAAAPAGALAALGVWAAFSAAWGGVPDAGWTTLDQLLIGGAAIAVGAMLATSPARIRVIQNAVLAGITAHGIELLARLALSSNAPAYFHGRVLYGLVGYQNAQAAILAIGVPPALALAAHHRRAPRAAGAAAVVLLCAGVLLTESRGGLLALVVGVLIQIVWSRNVRLAATAVVSLAAAGALIPQLRHVDRALFAGHPTHAVRVYVVLALAAAAAAGLVTQLRLPVPSRRVLAAAAAAALCAFGVVAAVTVGPRLGSAWSQLTSDAPPNAAPGSTRLVSLSLNGRRDAWRVALGAASAHPLLGEGAASFSLRWTEKRRLGSLYILQPHSLELELLSELGIVGLVAFLVFVALAFRGIARSARGVGGTAAGVISIVLIQASYDWTWSFPGLVVPTLLVVGAACSGGARLRAVPATVSIVALLVVSGAAIAAPYLAQRQVDIARTLQVADPAAAWSHTESASKLDPWDEAARSTRASIAESVGKFALAAREYHGAAALAAQPWVDYYQEALAWQRAGFDDRRLAACGAARAQNPLEVLLQRDQCG